MFRIAGGNDRLAIEAARQLSGRLLLRCMLKQVRQHDRGVRATVDQSDQRELDADYLVAALPASTLRDVDFEPGLPVDQRRAVTSLRYGCATRVLLQFDRPFWRKPLRAKAFGSDLPTGAVWDGAEDQGTRTGILSLLAGGRASGELRDIISKEGLTGVVARLAWLGDTTKLVSAHTISWEEDGLARGGYAYFDPSFEPQLRPWLARPFGRVLFAGEHTSERWQGYMNGAIESGRRAAAEVKWLKQLTV
jgi:monoamine oxidase